MLMNIVIITSHFFHNFHSSFFFFDSLLFHLKFLLSSFFRKFVLEVSNLRSLLFSHGIKLFQPLLLSFLDHIKIPFFMLFKSIPVINNFPSFNIFKFDAFLWLYFSYFLLILFFSSLMNIFLWFYLWYVRLTFLLQFIFFLSLFFIIIFLLLDLFEMMLSQPWKIIESVIDLLLLLLLYLIFENYIFLLYRWLELSISFYRFLYLLEPIFIVCW